MANLIISLMAIILVSALCVVGLNYSGTIYSESQADAQATELIANASKVATALRSWSTANGSQQLSGGAGVNWSNGISTDLTTGTQTMYLDALPQLGVYATGDQNTNTTDYYFKAMPLNAVDLSNEGGVTTSTSPYFDSLFAVITSVPVCKAIARLSRGDSAVPLIISAGSTLPLVNTTNTNTPINFSTVMASSEFDCIYNDANGNSTLDSGESMYFIYKVF